jgi:hypothetical protein
MKFSPRFYWFYLQRRHAEALATLQQEAQARKSSHELWSFYKLGMYASVSASPRRDDGWRGGFAHAVSLAACGQAAAATQEAGRLAQRWPREDLRTALADALAPYLPEFALGLLDGIERTTPLRAALLLRTDATHEARALLQHALQHPAASGRSPQFHLLASNADPESPAKQLAHLNAFLGSYRLPPLALLDPDRPPGPTNLRIADALPSRRGPLVSIVMTAYQSGGRIGPAIRSVLEQTYQDIELIVVDDASDDDTAAVIGGWAARDPRVQLIRLPCNVGTYAAKNIGLRRATGEFATCHDSDDWSHPLKIERQVEPLLNDRKLVYSMSEWVRMQDDGHYYARPVHPLMRVNPSSPLFRRRLVLERTGAWDWVRTGADSEFAARLRLVFGRFAMRRIRQPLALGAHRPNSLVTAPETGFDAAGIPPARLAYWEGWGGWHIDELRAGRSPRMPDTPPATRPFAVPAALLADPASLARCLQDIR